MRRQETLFSSILRSAPWLLALVVLFSVFFTPREEPQKHVVLASTDDITGLASTHVLKAVLEDRLGWHVDLMCLSVATLYESIASGDVDAVICTWLPITNKVNYDKIHDRVETVGVNLAGTRLGLLVPSYLPVNSIEELNGYASQFNNRIVITDPSSGTVQKTVEAQEAYALDAFSFYGGSEPLALAVINDAIKNGQWFVTVGWTPHSYFAGRELKFLEDPLKVYGEPESIYTLAKKGLNEKKPLLYRFLRNFQWTADNLQDVLDLSSHGYPAFDKAARRWMEDNTAIVDSWLEMGE